MHVAHAMCLCKTGAYAFSSIDGEKTKPVFRVNDTEKFTIMNMATCIEIGIPYMHI